MEYRIIADSCADLTPELKEELGVATVPLTMRLGNKEFLDDGGLDLPAFMEEMQSCTEKVGSASPPPTTYQDAFVAAKNAFAVTLSSKLSGSYDSAVMGKRFAEELGTANVHVFDSKSASAGEVLVTMKVRELISQKLSREAIIEQGTKFINNSSPISVRGTWVGSTAFSFDVTAATMTVCTHGEARLAISAICHLQCN